MAEEFTGHAVRCFERIVAEASLQTGLEVVADEWKRGPVIGLTSAFGETIFSQCMNIKDFTNWAYHAWAVLWPATGGIIITWLNEGIRLLKGMGYEPRITVTTWQLTGEPIVLPQGPEERIAYGNADLSCRVSVAFMLCFGNEEIAIAYDPG